VDWTKIANLVPSLRKRDTLFPARDATVKHQQLHTNRSTVTMAAELNEKAIQHTTSGSSSKPAQPHNGSAISEENKETQQPTIMTVSDGNSNNVDANEPYQHLPSEQAEILERQISYTEVKTSVLMIYGYASPKDIIIIAISALCAIAAGASLPLMTIIFGNLQNIFQNYLYGNGTETYDQFVQKLSGFVLYYVYLSIGQFVATYVCTIGFIYTGDHITAKIRTRYFESCTSQNIGFFDKISAGEVTTHITSDTNLIQDGISQKLALSLTALATFVAAFVIGFVTYWKLALILSCSVVALTLNVRLGTRRIIKYSRVSLASYAEGGSLASEVISSIRNTIAFGTQDRMARKYDKHLQKAEHHGFRVKWASALMISIMWLIFFLSYSLAFWQGSRFLVNDEIPISKLLIITMSVMMGSSSFGGIMPNLQALLTAVAASTKIFSTIARISPIDPTSEDGEKLDHVEGHIRLENVQHIYPSRPTVVVLHAMTLDIPAGKTTALVGGSGSGKSTIVGLIERFYEPVKGKIYLDGHDISKLNLKWLRQQISLVSQEPTLFGTTVYHNIRYGLVGTTFEDESDEKQRDVVIEAAKKANAHDFVMALPKGYDTDVGEGGFLLSGGQKQRIAIARAIVCDPKSK
jgi:ATP-binding cassette subfamily B (MDR/TAP) protein 1